MKTPAPEMRWKRIIATRVLINLSILYAWNRKNYRSGLYLQTHGIESYPVFSAARTKPFRFFNIILQDDPGIERNASPAPPGINTTLAPRLLRRQLMILVSEAAMAPAISNILLWFRYKTIFKFQTIVYNSTVPQAKNKSLRYGIRKLAFKTTM